MQVAGPSAFPLWFESLRVFFGTLVSHPSGFVSATILFPLGKGPSCNRRQGFVNILSRNNKVRIIAATGTLMLIAAALGCNGFFVDPVLTSMTVGPTATINEGGTVQMSAVGTYNDGSQQSLSSLSWSSDTPSVATVSGSGLVTGVTPGSATITGASGTVSGTATITVALQNVTGITVSPTTANIISNGGTRNLTAQATISGGAPVDVTATATWTASDTSGNPATDVTLSQGTDPMVVQTTSTTTVGEQITITASYLGGSGLTYTANAVLTVTGP
jgi:hypothetical protein